MDSNSALVVIDMQMGVFDGNIIPPVSGAEKLLSNIQRLSDACRRAFIPVIFIQHDGEAGHPLEKETPGWCIHPALKVSERDIVICKHTPDSFYKTRLQDELESGKIKKLIIAGIQTEFCIDTTCRRAFSIGYDVVLAKDAHSTWDTEQLPASRIIEHHNNLLSEWFVESKSVIQITDNLLNQNNE